MKNISMQIPYSFYEIEEAKVDLDNLYNHMVYSSVAIKEDLRGLDVAITILSKISLQLSREENHGF